MQTKLRKRKKTNDRTKSHYQKPARFKSQPEYHLHVLIQTSMPIVGKSIARILY